MENHRTNIYNIFFDGVQADRKRKRERRDTSGQRITGPRVPKVDTYNNRIFTGSGKRVVDTESVRLSIRTITQLVKLICSKTCEKSWSNKITYKMFENKMLRNMRAYVDKAQSVVSQCIDAKLKPVIASCIRDTYKECVLCGGQGIISTTNNCKMVTAPLLLAIMPNGVRDDKPLHAMLSSDSIDPWGEFLTVANEHFAETGETFQEISFGGNADGDEGGEKKEEKNPNPQERKVHKPADEKKIGKPSAEVRKASATAVRIARKQANDAAKADAVDVENEANDDDDEATQPQHVTPPPSNPLVNRFNLVDEEEEEEEEPKPVEPATETETGKEKKAETDSESDSDEKKETKPEAEAETDEDDVVGSETKENEPQPVDLVADSDTELAYHRDQFEEKNKIYSVPPLESQTAVSTTVVPVSSSSSASSSMSSCSSSASKNTVAVDDDDEVVFFKFTQAPKDYVRKEIKEKDAPVKKEPEDKKDKPQPADPNCKCNKLKDKSRACYHCNFNTDLAKVRADELKTSSVTSSSSLSSSISVSSSSSSNSSVADSVVVSSSSSISSSSSSSYVPIYPGVPVPMSIMATAVVGQKRKETPASGPAEGSSEPAKKKRKPTKKQAAEARRAKLAAKKKAAEAEESS